MTQKIRDISVVICTYSQDRWDDLVAAVKSVQVQTLPPREIIVVSDHNPALLQVASKHLSGVILVENTEVRGLSGARNSGIKRASSQYIAFLDDDALAAPDWLLRLSESYTDPRVLGTGGSVMPLWMEGKPAWFPEEFYWVVGCSYRGLPQTLQAVRNPIGANMSLRREIFETVGGFHSDIGRIGKLPNGCEETELCIRARQNWPESVFLYQPQACVSHRVPSSRSTWRYFCLRCYSEGRSKALVSQYVGRQDALASERTYTLRVLPQGVLRNLLKFLLRQDFAALLRTGALIAGLVVTMTGYLSGTIFSKSVRPDSGFLFSKVDSTSFSK